MENFIEEEVTVEGEFKISGTITLPDQLGGEHPAVIIVPGTGSNDRNGNSDKLNLNLYKLLAEFLTSIGYTTIRYDKRGLYKSEGNFTEAGISDLMNDIKSVYNFMKSRNDINDRSIYLLGHSEGSILSTLAYDKVDLKGLILLSGAGISIKTALSMQSKEAYEEIQRMKGIKGFFLKLLYSKNKIEKTQNKLYEKALNTEDDVIKFQMRKFPAKWLREHLQYSDDDILQILKNIKIPTLCITGEKDVQADPNDLIKVDSLGNKNITVKIIQNMDHILKYYSGEKTIMNLMKQYKNEVDEPLHEELKNSIQNWLDSKNQGQIV